MSNFICPIIVGLIAFAGLSATCWLYDQWRETFSGMNGDRDGSAIADQGDDWAPWGSSQPGEDSPTTTNRRK